MDLTTDKELSIPTTFSSKMADYAAFFKLRLASLVVFSAILGYLIAVDFIIWPDLLWLCLGGFLVTGSSNGYNQIIEKELDRLMDRTKVRPLVTGRMTTNEAIVVASISGLAGVFILWTQLNQLSGVLALISLVLYVAFYTPLKQKTPWAVLVGAFPGAIPPMLGWVAATGHFGLEAGLLFALQFMWQFPHFWAIAWKASDDYAKAGFHLLPSKAGKDFTSAFLILVYTLFMILVSVLPVLFGFTGIWALLLILIGGLLMLIPSIQLFKTKSDKSATKVMFASFIYVPLVLVAWYIFKT